MLISSDNLEIHIFLNCFKAVQTNEWLRNHEAVHMCGYAREALRLKRSGYE